MTDDRSLSWQVFFPREADFETRGAPDWLVALLNDSALSDGPGRRPVVRIAWGAAAVSDVLAPGLEGLVVLNAAPSTLKLQQAGFRYVRQFIALPSLKNLRWLIPADHGTVAGASTTIPRPHSRRGKSQRLALMLLLKAGRLRTRSRLVTVASRRQPGIVSAFDRLFPEVEFDLAVSTGTPGPMRKPAIACFDRGGTELAFAKVATTSAAETLIRNEASVLRRMGFTLRLRNLGPRLLSEELADGRATIVQSALAGRAAPTKLGDTHRRFLEALETHQTHRLPVHPFIQGLCERLRRRPELAAAGMPLLGDALRELDAVSLPATLMHGDFAPWNLRLTADGLRAFDWEYGVFDGLPGLDELHHVWQTGMLLEKQDAELAVRALDAQARSLPYGLDAMRAAALVSVYLVHGLLQRFELGCDGDDVLLRAYRTAVQTRPGRYRTMETAAV